MIPHVRQENKQLRDTVVPVPVTVIREAPNTIVKVDQQVN